MNNIKDKEFVFTGRIRIPRHQAWELVSKCGGYIGTGITGSTDYAVVGGKPGQKFGKAQDKGIEILSEDTFFNWVNEVQQELVDVSKDTKEEIEPEIPIQEWIKGKHCIQCLDCGLAFSSEQPLTKCPLCSAEEEKKIWYNNLSFNNKDTLQQILIDNPGILTKILPSIKCPGCEEIIPYGTTLHGPGSYYCFSCHRYFTKVNPDFYFEDKSGNIYNYPSGWIGNLGDQGTWEEFSRTEKFITRINWKLGITVVCTFAEFCRNEELVGMKDYYNSVEWLVSITGKLQAYAPIAQSSTHAEVVSFGPDGMPGSDEDKNLYTTFLQQKNRRLQRRVEHGQKRFDKRQARRLQNFTEQPTMVDKPM